MKKIIFLIPLLLFTFCSKKSDSVSSESKSKPTIAVVNYPLYAFTKEIGGEHVEVYFPEIEGDPAFWKPGTEELGRYQEADLIIANGAGYASWMAKVSLPASKIIDTSAGFKSQWIYTEEGTTHSHGPDGEHVHASTAFTTWLDLKLALKQGEKIHEGLKKLLPEKEKDFQINCENLRKKLSELDQQMEQLSNTLENTTLIGSHPVYQYLAKGYGLSIKSVHWEPEVMPSEKEWTTLGQIAKDYTPAVMIWEAKPISEIETRLQEIGIPYLVFEPCGNKPGSGDFFEIMKDNYDRLNKIIP